MDVSYFKYLGRVLLASYNNCPVVIWICGEHGINGPACCGCLYGRGGWGYADIGNVLHRVISGCAILRVGVVDHVTID